MAQKNNVAEVAADFADYMTLFAAVIVADSIPTLNNKWPFTAFAPTNAAFLQNYPEGTAAIF